MAGSQPELVRVGVLCYLQAGKLINRFNEPFQPCKVNHVVVLHDFWKELLNHFHHDNVNRYLVLAVSPENSSARLAMSWYPLDSAYDFSDEANDIISAMID